MSNALETFFRAWAMSDDRERLDTITRAVTDAVRYDDPQTPQTVVGVEALAAYVGQFSANAPGWQAAVMAQDSIGGTIRATVAFSGPGPQGDDVTQLGQYFVELEDGRLARLVGFVGLQSAS